jgi:hypothetical protein
MKGSVTYISTMRGERVRSGGSNAVRFAGASDDGEFTGEVLIFSHFIEDPLSQFTKCRCFFFGVSRIGPKRHFNLRGNAKDVYGLAQSVT